MNYYATIEAVNGTAPGEASGVTYDIKVYTPTGAVEMLGVIPAYRLPEVIDGTLHVRGFTLDERVVVSEISTGDTTEYAITTPEPVLIEECGGANA